MVHTIIKDDLFSHRSHLAEGKARMITRAVDDLKQIVLKCRFRCMSYEQVPAFDRSSSSNRKTSLKTHKKARKAPPSLFSWRTRSHLKLSNSNSAHRQGHRSQKMEQSTNDPSCLLPLKIHIIDNNSSNDSGYHQINLLPITSITKTLLFSLYR